MKNQRGLIVKNSRNLKVKGTKVSTSSRNASVSKSLNKTSKSSKLVKKSADNTRKPRMARQTGDYGITPSKVKASPEKSQRISPSPSSNQLLQKSPKVAIQRKKKILNQKSAGRAIAKKDTEKATPRRVERVVKRRAVRKEIVIAIEAPRSKSRNATSELASSVQTPSRTKARMQILSKTREEEDDFMKEVRRSATPKKAVKAKVKSNVVKTESVDKSAGRGRSASRGKGINKVKTADMIKPSPRVNLQSVKRAIKQEVEERSTPKKAKPSKSESKSKSRERSRRDESKNLKEEKSPVQTKAAIKSTKPTKFAKPTKVIKSVKEASPTAPREQLPKQEVDLAIKSVEKTRTPKKVSSRAIKQKRQTKVLKEKKATSKKPVSVIPVRTPTKIFKKEKTPSPESEVEEEEPSESSSSSEVNKKRPVSRRGAIIDMAIKKEKPIKEEPLSEEEESESSKKKSSESESESRKLKTPTKIVKRPVRHQLSYKVDTRGISEEISKILQKIEEKKKKAQGGVTVKESKKKKTVTAGKRRVAVVTKKLSAKDYDFKLQTNPNIKTEHIVKIAELVEKPTKTNSDVLLTILELASNAEYYNFSYSNNSKMFWEDVVLYEELADVFEDFKGETLKKYWHILSTVGDVNKIADLVKKHKKFLDGMKIKLLPIIYAIRGYFTGMITDFEDSVKNMKVEVRKNEIFEGEEVDEETGEIRKVTVKKTTTKMRNKFEQEKPIKKWEGNNYRGIPEEVFGTTQAVVDAPYYKFVKKVEDEEKKKFEYLTNLTEEEKKRILSINEEDKFVFRVIDNVVTALQTEFPQCTRNYIVEALNGNSMNIEKAYQFLRDPIKNSNLLFNDADDKTIIEMKKTAQFENLKKEKGSDRVQEREDYLLA